MTRLVLIDGNAILHRAYHALPPFTAPDGTLVNAVYGFISMLFKIVNDLKPTHIAVAFDRAAPTFRKKMFKDYQAQRPKMEDELISQIDKVHDVVRAFGIPIYEFDGFEADDIIGTIAKQCQMLNDKCQIIVVTGDRDLLQLVDNNTFLYMPTKGLGETKLYDESAVKEKMGVTPKQISDYKALAGDASDNYPGVPGIGPKTAAKLLAKYATLKGILKAKKLSSTDRESALLGLKLATIRTDVPIEIDLQKAQITTLDTPSSRKALEDLHFPSLLKRLGNAMQSEKTEKKPSAEQQQLF